VLLGSARLIRGEARAGFTFPAEQAFAFELPDEVAKTAVTERVEVTRVVAEATRGIVIGGLLTPLGLIPAAVTQYLQSFADQVVSKEAGTIAADTPIFWSTWGQARRGRSATR